jgi:hypothetical protein
MRKPQTAAFGIRRAVAAPPAIEAPVFKPSWRWSHADLTISYGVIVKLVIALWAATIAAAMLWP